MLKVTTSWDDGDILDKRLSDLLSRYGIRGTFYISKSYRPERLSDQDVQELFKTYEIGAHTINHPDLRTLSSVERKSEVEGSKKWLEGLLDAEVKMFCYPKGFHDASVVSAVKEAGFLGARTTELARLDIANPYLMPATIQVYPVNWRSRKQRSPKLRALGVSIFSMYSWLSIAKATFDIATKKGGVFHLYGHSWEIERYNMWDGLEKFLKYIAHKKNCVYLTNSQIFK